MILGNERGMTLLEILVAMLLLATALVGLAASYPYAMYAVATGGYQTTATLLAQQCIDLAKNVSQYGTLDTSGLSAACPSNTGYGGFTRTVLVQDGATYGFPSTVKVVTSTVAFTDNTGTTPTTLRIIVNQ